MAAVDIEMVEEHRGLARSVANKFCGHTRAHRDDYVAAAELGLVEAISSFDPHKGRFGSWAYKHILRRVLEAVRVTEHPLLGPGAFQDRFVVRRAVRELEDGDARYEPSDADVAMLTGLSVDRVAAVREAPTTQSIDADEHRFHRWEAREHGEPEFTDRVAALVEWPYLQRWGLWVLPRRELHVIARRFGLDGQPPATLQELADDLHVSRETVRQWENKALDRLRQEVGVPTTA